ncbi:restriction endonuclease subunit S [Staphylococcus hominis]|uniref:Restriction endonuclease subunit S n=1 Tax=Staphylococcus hominis TaxID=1290 RepID=A0A8X8GUM1_STAHO|nr:restriction endonuclease subunit S [Staphylococcus hominis]MCM5673443.1 restriction endonuclease subunit S [Staphylococcus hominis]
MEFNKYKLKDLTVNGKGEYGIGAPAVKYSPNLYKYLRITDIDDNGFINTNQMKSINDKNEEKYLLKANDIVFARTGNSTGKSYFYNSDDGPLVYAGFLIKFSLDPTKLNPKYLRYYTLTNEYKGWVNQFSIGSTRKNINAKIFGDMVISLPPRYYQDFVVNILDSLERKVKINKQMVANLEELSQILFKRWFIDFEFPNEEGVPYKSSGGEMIDSEIGEIPKGWEISKLDKIINIKSGKRPRNKVNIMDNKNKTPIIGASKIMGYTSDYLESEPILVMGRVGTHGVIQRFNNNVWPSDNTFIIKSKFMIYTYFILINIDYKSLNRGSTQPLLSQKDIKNINIIIPKSDSLIVKYEEITNIYFKEIDVIKDQISYLIELRDTLLSKLMSGELEIPNNIEVNTDELSI